MSQKIETLVQEKGGDINSKKPPRMHTSRYNKLQRKYSYYYEEKSHQALNAELRAWYGPKAEPYIDDIF